MNGGWGGKEMGSIHSERKADAETVVDVGTAQAELLSLGTRGRSEATGDLFPCLQAEGKVATWTHRMGV